MVHPYPRPNPVLGSISMPEISAILGVIMKARAIDAKFQLWADEFWDGIFLQCRGTAPTSEERESTRGLMDQAALIFYRERHEKGTTKEAFLDAINRAAQGIVDSQRAQA